jgi:TRAP-type mannitol/chloroaromatic compound transport system permease small subunit
LESGASSPGRGSGARNAAATAFNAVVVGLNALGSLWILFITAIVCIDVAARYLFNSPVTGVPLVITMSLIAIVFLQLPDGLRAGRVTRNEALLAVLLERRPRIGLALQAVFHLCGAAMMAFLVVYIWPMFVKAWTSRAFLGNRGDFVLPEWPFKLLIVVGAVMTGLQFLLLFRRDLIERAALSRETKPDDGGATP